MLNKLLIQMQNSPFSVFTENPQHSCTGPATKIQIYLRQTPIIHQKRTPGNQKCISTSTETIELSTSQSLAPVSTSVLKMKKKTHTHRGIYFPYNSNATWNSQGSVVIGNRSISTLPQAVTKTCSQELLKQPFSEHDLPVKSYQNAKSRTLTF